MDNLFIDANDEYSEPDEHSDLFGEPQSGTSTDTGILQIHHPVSGIVHPGEEPGRPANIYPDRKPGILLKNL